MLMEELETLAVVVTEQKVKNQPAQPAVFANGKKVVPAKKKVATKALKAAKSAKRGGGSSDDSSDQSDSDEEQDGDTSTEEEEDKTAEEEEEEVEEDTDSEDEYFDQTPDQKKAVIRPSYNSDDDGEIHDPLDGKSEVFFGQKALVRREFLVTPRVNMTDKKDKEKEKDKRK